MEASPVNVRTSQPTGGLPDLSKEIVSLPCSVLEKRFKDTRANTQIVFRFSRRALHEVCGRSSSHRRWELDLTLKSRQCFFPKYADNTCDAVSVKLGDRSRPACTFEHFDKEKTAVREFTRPLGQNSMSSQLDGEGSPLMTIRIPYLPEKNPNSWDRRYYSCPAAKSRDPLSKAVLIFAHGAEWLPTKGQSHGCSHQQCHHHHRRRQSVPSSQSPAPSHLHLTSNCPPTLMSGNMAPQGEERVLPLGVSQGTHRHLVSAPEKLPVKGVCKEA